GDGLVWICGREIMLIGANNEQARTKIQGLTLIGAYVDEASTLPESYFNMLYSRLSLAGARMWLTSNPEGPGHWLLVKWLQRARLWIDRDGREHRNDAPDALNLHRVTFRLDDNPNLDPEYVADLKKSYTGLWYRRYIGAEWVAADGAVYDCWEQTRHVIAHRDLPKMSRYLGVGLDYGTTNPSAGILLGLGVDRRLYAVDEWWLRKPADAPGYAPGQQSESLRAWLAGLPALPEWVILDPSAAPLKVQLGQDGVEHLIDADNHVTYGIATVSTLLATASLRISDRCVNLIRELPSYSWDDKATAKGIDAPVKINDHAADALRYAVTTTESLWRGNIDTREAA
ncbi:MAG TPA: phage terminase large subunit, partial [Jatrophihabitantaceae bacterium]|nr:phage terminase large subunit [Jatrophihabitantaceae bacterium]